MSFLFNKGGKNPSKGPVGRRKRSNSKKEELAQPKATPHVGDVVGPKESDDEVLSQLPEYFYEPEVDVLDRMLQSLPEDDTEQYLADLIKVRNRQHDIVNSQLSDRVMSNYDAFVQGMMKIKELGDDLKTTAVLCRNGRANLYKANHDLISGPLAVVATNRKRILYKGILDHLNEIKRIVCEEEQLRKLIDEGDYPSAIELCTKLTGDISKYRAFHCVRGLSNSVQESYRKVLGLLEYAALEVTRSSFSEVTYARLLRAYHLSGKSHLILGRLQANFLDSVRNGTKDLIFTNVMKADENISRVVELKKLGPQALSSQLHEDHFTGCLQDVLAYLCDIMFSHYQMREWHRKQDAKEDEEDLYSDVKAGLESYGKTIWTNMQNCLIAILKNSSLPTFKIDVFLDVLDNVNKLTELGEDFSNSKSPELQNCINQQSKNYFEHFHKQKGEDLRIMLENEMWEVMPVDDDFGIHDIKEFKTLARQAGFENSGASSALLRGVGSSALSLSSGVSPMASLFITGNPFRREQRGNDRDGDGTDESDEEVDAALMADYVDEDDSNQIQPIRSRRRTNKAQGQKGPILTSTCINLTRFFGKYLQTMSTLKPIAYDVFIGATQLFDYYMFCTYFFFGRKAQSSQPAQNSTTASINRYLTSFRTDAAADAAKAASVHITPDSFVESLQNITLRSAFSRIHATLIKPLTAEEKHERFVMHMPMGLGCDMGEDSEQTMFGLNKRAIAAESLMFLEGAMLELKPYILQLIPPNNRQHCVQFYENSVNMAHLVRNEIYSSVAERFVNLSNIVPQIEKVKWNTSEVNLNHNPYVNTLTKEFKSLHRKLMAIQKKGVVTADACQLMLDCAIHEAMELLIEGYSRVKKCTVEGRTMMALDCQIFQTELTEMTATRPIPHTLEVDAYIKAFYSNDLVQWIREHAREYTERQLLGLAVCAGANMPRRQRQELLKQVEDVTSRNK